MNNLVIRKSKHVILNEDHDADRLKMLEKTYDDARCVQFNVPIENDGLTNVNEKYDDYVNDTIVWKRSNDMNLTDQSNELSNVYETIQNSQCLKLIDKFCNMMTSIYESVTSPETNKHFWNVSIVIVYVFYEIFFNLVMGIATIMVAVILNLEEGTSCENKQIECNLNGTNVVLDEYKKKLAKLDENVKSNEENYKRFVSYK